MDTIDPSIRTGRRLLARLFSGGLLVVVMWPVTENLRRKPRDSFPLSYYPMFSAKRDAAEKVTCLVGIDGSGEQHHLHYRYAGAGGENMVRKQIRKLANGPSGEELCRRVARRLAHSRKGPYSDLRRVLLVTEEYKLDEYFTGNQRPIRQTIRASCDVPQG